MRPFSRSPASLASAASVVSATLALLATGSVFTLAAGLTACTQLADDLLGIDGGNGEVASDAATATGVSYPDGGEITNEVGTGTNCGTEVTTGVVLCTGVTSCPSITVDQTALTGCGFRINGGDSYDLECGCNGYLCPLGTPTTCDEATTLLSNQTVALVCEQVSEGHCTQPGGTTTTTTTTTSTCDQTCAANCVGTPTCLELCGC